MDNKKISFSEEEITEYFGTKLILPKQVYGPMEDTDLSIRFLKKWLKNFLKSKEKDKFLADRNNFRFLEMGCGSGALSFYLVKRFLKKKIPFYHVGIDINPIAVEACKYSAKLNNFETLTNFYTGSFFSPLELINQKQKFDLILFNPPYLASELETINKSNRKLIDLAWEGGFKGDEVTLEFLDQLPKYLKNNAEFMFISSSNVNQQYLMKKLKKLGFKILEEHKKHVFFENIILYHCRYE